MVEDTTTPVTNPQAGADAGTTPQVGNSNPQAGTEPNPNSISKEEYDKIVAKRDKLLDEVKNLRERVQKVDTEQEDKLKQAGEFKPLYEQAVARVQALEPVAERYTRLSGIVLTSFTEQVKDWPKEVKDLLPTGDKVDPLDYIEAVDKYRPLAKRLGANTQQSGRSGNAPNPSPAGQEDDKAKRERLAAELRAKGFGRI